ncbi:MAG: methyltransferase domain-containing protein [Candidatus Pacebacteria bacterium]|nr:methyltransferase domain-containing protein [Candidatus Paceibacterota bacterium]
MEKEEINLNSMEGRMRAVEESKEQKRSLLEVEEVAEGDKKIFEEGSVKSESEKIGEVREKIESDEGDKKEITTGHKEESLEEIERNILEKEGSFNDKFSRLEKMPKDTFKKKIEGTRNKISQMVADMGSIETKRGEFTNDIIKAIEKIKEDGDLPKGFFENIENMISIGSGHGENPFGILGKYLSENTKAIFIDPYAAPSEKISQNDNIRHLGQKFEDVKIERQSGEKNIVEASNFLQLFELEEKKEALEKMVKLAGPGGKIIIVDEIKRDGFDGAGDRALNRFYNWSRGEYNRLSEEDYEKMFKEAGLKMVAKNQYNRASFVFMLEVPEETIKSSIEA